MLVCACVCLCVVFSFSITPFSVFYPTTSRIVVLCTVLWGLLLPLPSFRFPYSLQLALTDFLQSLAAFSKLAPEAFVMPEFADTLAVKSGLHPILFALQKGERLIPNDIVRYRTICPVSCCVCVRACVRA